MQPGDGGVASGAGGPADGGNSAGEVERRSDAGRGASPAAEVSVVLANTNLLFAQALSAFLTSAGMKVLGVAAIMDEAHALVEEHSPDVLLVGLSPGDRAALSLVEKVSERRPEVAVLAIVQHEDEAPDDAAAPLFAGVIAMDMSSAALLDAIESAGRGKRVGPVRRRSAPRSHEDFLLEQLTPRELDVLELLAEGLDSQDIAERLDIKTNTVRTHVQNILSKLHVSSRLGAASLAIRRGGVRGFRPPGTRYR